MNIKNKNEQEQAQRDFELLDHADRSKMELVFDLTSEKSKLAKLIAKTFNFRLYYFRHNLGATSKRVVFKGGTTDCGSCAFILIDQEHELWTVGHEMWHLLELNNADLILDIEKKLRSQFSEKAILDTNLLMDTRSILIKGKVKNPNPPTEQQVFSELFADLNAQIFIKTKFWSELSNKELDIERKKNFDNIYQMLANTDQTHSQEYRLPLKIITNEILENFVEIWRSRIQKIQSNLLVI